MKQMANNPPIASSFLSILSFNHRSLEQPLRTQSSSNRLPLFWCSINKDATWHRAPRFSFIRIQIKSTLSARLPLEVRPGQRCLRSSSTTDRSGPRFSRDLLLFLEKTCSWKPSQACLALSSKYQSSGVSSAGLLRLSPLHSSSAARAKLTLPSRSTRNWSQLWFLSIKTLHLHKWSKAKFWASWPDSSAS
jgi:hypothetical protein